MKHRSLKFIVVLTVLGMFLVGCAGWTTTQQKMETMTISYENIGTLAFPFAKAYIDQRAANGTLVGADLIKAKVGYNSAVDTFSEAIKLSKMVVAGQPLPPGKSLQAVLIQVAKKLADVTGGKVENSDTTLSMPKTK